MNKKTICKWESTCDDDCRRPYGNCPENCQNYKPYVSLEELEKEVEKSRFELELKEGFIKYWKRKCKDNMNDVIELAKENAELKKEISILLSCKNCPENKGGYICKKEYNNKCLAQKIEYIKELKEENAGLEKENEQLKAYESHWDEIEEDAKVIAKENAELKAQNNDLRAFAEKLSENHANEWQEQQQVITELRGKLEKVSEWVKEQEYPDGCIDCEPWDTEKLKEILK